MPVAADLRWDHDGVHEYHRQFRRVLDSYPGDRMAVGEVWVRRRRAAGPLRPPGRAEPRRSTSSWSRREWGATTFRDAIERSLAAMAGVGAPCTWVLANHDVDRAATRYGGGAVGLAPGPGGRAGAAVAARRGLRLQRRRAGAGQRRPARLGAAGPDLGAQRAHRARPRRRAGADAVVAATSRRSASRPAPTSWLPMPAEWAALTVGGADGDPDSTLSLYRAALGAAPRRARPARRRVRAGCDAPGRTAWPTAAASWSRAAQRRRRAVPLPAGEVLLASGPLAATGRCRPTPRSGCEPSAERRPQAEAGALGVDRAVARGDPRSSGRRRRRATCEPRGQEAHPGERAEHPQGDRRPPDRRRRETVSTTESSSASATSARGCAPGTPSRAAASLSASAPLRTRPRTTSSGTVSIRCQPAAGGRPARQSRVAPLRAARPARRRARRSSSTARDASMSDRRRAGRRSRPCARRGRRTAAARGRTADRRRRRTRTRPPGRGAIARRSNGRQLGQLRRGAQRARRLVHAAVVGEAGQDAALLGGEPPRPVGVEVEGDAQWSRPARPARRRRRPRSAR